MTSDMKAALDALYDKLSTLTEHHGGFPYNLNYEYKDLCRFLRYSLNNLGDPYIDSVYAIGTKEIEREVVRFFADLYHLDKPWGYVTGGGTEGNYYGLWLGTRLFPDAPIIASHDSHYSVTKAATIAKTRLLCAGSDRQGEVDYADFNGLAQATTGPLIVNVNIGTTFSGAVDRIDRICDLLTQMGRPFHLHCDAALGGLLEPFLNQSSLLNFARYPIGSLAVSGHKFIGAPVPCGIVLARRSAVRQMEQRVDYIGSVDSTILSSRSGLAVLFMWQAICRRNFAVEARKCRRNAEYLRTALQLLGWEPQLNPLSTTVVFKSPDKAFCNHWQLSTSHDRAHVVVMQNHSRTWLDRFLKDLGTRQSGEWRHELDHFDPNHAASAPGKLSL